MDFSWMAWTGPTAIFFAVILGLIVTMSIWEYFSPGGQPRTGILRFETTRGDRLFVTLLGSAFINLAWLAMIDLNLWWALAVSALFGVLVFRYV
jgi:predicted small integral membrane protein